MLEILESQQPEADMAIAKHSTARQDPRMPDRVMLSMADIFVRRCLSEGHPSLDHADHQDTRWSAYAIEFLEHMHQVASIYDTTTLGTEDRRGLKYNDWLHLLLVEPERRDRMIRSFDRIATVGDTGFGAGLRYVRDVLPRVHPETVQAGSAIAAAMLKAFQHHEATIEPDAAPSSLVP
ncbi:hypothetical protein CRT60_00435 [Azospirillum palustre]|uniref:Uncharacterized protein n=1 Tax=Azospirillum palustre TaxID=2044885 RepID=A0A2B8BDL1_9PROT|nr:hypothetical protein [Azospirillum palustre]PGH59434.1 hypothetical protein CRT60_00435 [Azospirillum palustre]